MSKTLSALVWGGVLSLAMSAASPANATLHGWCGSGATSTCLDNGSNTPTAQSALNPFGFTVSPRNQTGTLFLDVLVPNNNVGAGPFAITGAATATATLVSPTAWTSGQLDSYLGISASPANPIGGYLDASETALDPAATGFFVYQAKVGTQTLAGPGGPLNQTFDISSAPIGTYIVAFLESGEAFDATANSGALLITTGSGTTRGGSVPEPASMLVLGSGLLGLGILGRRRNNR